MSLGDKGRMGISFPRCCLSQVLPMTACLLLGIGVVTSHLLLVRWALADAHQVNFRLQHDFLCFIACSQPSNPEAELSHWEINPLLSGVSVMHMRTSCAHADAFQVSNVLLCPTDPFAAGPHISPTGWHEQAQSSIGKGRNAQLQKLCQEK